MLDNRLHPDASFWNGLLLLLAAFIAFAIMIASFAGVFRQRTAIRTSFFLAAIVSSLFVLYGARILSSGSSANLDKRWLPDPIDDWPVLELFRFPWAGSTIRWLVYHF